jgi:hypothetical protein
MDAAEILGRFGVLGFVTVFQAIGVAVGRLSVSGARDAWRAGNPKGVLGPLFFSLLFAGFPLALASAFAGWAGLVAQTLILGTLVGFVVTPHAPLPAAQAEAARRPAAGRGEAARRPSRWRRIASALPALVAASGCAAALVGHPILGMTRGALCHVVKVEFLVVHSFPFLAIITLPRLRHLRWRVFQGFLFVTWSCLYLAFAMDGGQEVAGLAGFASGAIVTYLGFLLRWHDGHRVRDLATRWAASFALLFLAAVVTGAHETQVADATLWHGLVYFAALAGAEASGLYDLDWRRVLVRRAKPRPRRRAPSEEPVAR